MKTNTTKIKGTNIPIIYPEDSIIGEHLSTQSEWEPELTKILIKQCREIKDTAIMLDIGAHVGYFSLIAAHANPLVRSIAYEPHIELYKLLITNTIKYGTITYPYAIGEKEEKTILYCSKNNTGDNSLSLKEIQRFNNEDEIYEKPCTVIRFDKFSMPYKLVKIVKIDTQGSEFEIFQQVKAKVEPGIFWIVEEQKDMKQYLEDNNIQYKEVMYDLIFTL